MANDNHTISIDNNRLYKAVLLYALGHIGNLRLVVFLCIFA
jgi:hypothetical protein